MNDIKELSSGFDRATYSYRGSTSRNSSDNYGYSNDEERMIQRLQVLIDDRKITKRQAVMLFAVSMEEKMRKQLRGDLVKDRRVPKRSVFYCDYLLSELTSA